MRKKGAGKEGRKEGRDDEPVTRDIVRAPASLVFIFTPACAHQGESAVDSLLSHTQHKHCSHKLVTSVSYFKLSTRIPYTLLQIQEDDELTYQPGV